MRKPGSLDLLAPQAVGETGSITSSLMQQHDVRQNSLQIDSWFLQDQRVTRKDMKLASLLEVELRFKLTRLDQFRDKKSGSCWDSYVMSRKCFTKGKVYKLHNLWDLFL